MTLLQVVAVLVSVWLSFCFGYILAVRNHAPSTGRRFLTLWKLHYEMAKERRKVNSK